MDAQTVGVPQQKDTLLPHGITQERQPQKATYCWFYFYDAFGMTRVENSFLSPEYRYWGAALPGGGSDLMGSFSPVGLAAAGTYTGATIAQSTHTCTRAHTHIHMHIRTCAQIHMHTRAQHMCTHMHTHT